MISTSIIGKLAKIYLKSSLLTIGKKFTSTLSHKVYFVVITPITTRIIEFSLFLLLLLFLLFVFEYHPISSLIHDRKKKTHLIYITTLHFPLLNSQTRPPSSQQLSLHFNSIQFFIVASLHRHITTSAFLSISSFMVSISCGFSLFFIF